MTTTAGFLIEGAKSYIDACSAIEAFEKVVCGVCKDVYDKYKPQLVANMGLEDEECVDHVNKKPEDRFAELGVCQDSPSRRETLYIFLLWDGVNDSAPEISACVCLEFTTKGDRNVYAKLLRRISSIRPTDDSSYPGLQSSKKLSDLSSCAETLDELMREWLLCWPAGRKLE